MLSNAGQRKKLCSESAMFNAYTYVVIPLVCWLAAVSLLIVAYLARLEVRERIRNRRMDEERARLGLL